MQKTNYIKVGENAINKTVCFLLTFLLSVCMPFCSFALDTAFVEEPKTWYDNDNNFVNNPQQSIGKYTGVYSHYSDIEINVSICISVILKILQTAFLTMFM